MIVLALPLRTQVKNAATTELALPLSDELCRHGVGIRIYDALAGLGFILHGRIRRGSTETKRARTKVSNLWTEFLTGGFCAARLRRMNIYQTNRNTRRCPKS